MLMLPPHAMAGSKYYACKVPHLSQFLNSLNPLHHSLRQGQPSTAVMPPNFDANVIYAIRLAQGGGGAAAGSGAAILKPAVASPAETHEQATQRLAASAAAFKAAQQAKAASALKLSEAQREDAAAT